MLAKPKKNIFIIGSNSRLAKAIMHYYTSVEIILPKRKLYENWGREEKQEEIFNYFKDKVNKETLVFITSGVLNSSKDKEIINIVNFKLPYNIISALKGIDLKIITFGTILEKIRQTDNNYVRSKIELSDKINKLDASFLPKIFHFRLHTLYGYKLPSPFMFLGQIFESIKNKTDFYMSSGIQIREYHHLDDVVKALDCLIYSDIRGVSEITSGEGIQLRNLALTIFRAFNVENLINIGAIDIKYKEKLSNDYTRNPDLKNINFRKPKEGVIQYLKGIL